MPYSFPVSPSVLFGAPCWVGSPGTAFLFEKKNKNNKKKTSMYWLAAKSLKGKRIITTSCTA